MEFSKSNLLMTDHVFFEDNATQNVWFLIFLFKLSVSRVTIAAMLFLEVEQ